MRLEQFARIEAEAAKAARAEAAAEAGEPARPETLLEFIPRVSARLDAPVWLAPYVTELERAIHEPRRLVFAAPPQHGKSETAVHAIIRAAMLRPGSRSAYATYNAQRSARVQRKARAIATAAGMRVIFRQSDWVFPDYDNSTIIWASRKGGLSGEPVDTLLVVDDILKNRAEAESAIVRQECLDWFDDVAMTRCHPTASVIVMATRWHVNDLSGTLMKRGWAYTNIQALADGETDAEGRVIGDPLRRLPGEPLCEARKTRAALEEVRRTNAYSFASLYQGSPIPRGGAVFAEPTFYDKLPSDGYRVAFGIDLAYTAKSRADWSVIVELWCVDGERKADGKARPIVYVANVVRRQVQAPEFAEVIAAMRANRQAPVRWYLSGTEKGVADFITKRVKGIVQKPAVVDKYQRAQPLAEAWNDGRVRLPATSPDGEHPPAWVDAFIDEFSNFTGVGDAQDDQVDAAAAGFDEVTTRFRYGAAPTSMSVLF